MEIAKLISMFLPIEQRSGGVLYDYQTLITGFLAVAAAFGTIGMMAWTEARSQSRHEATLRIVLADRNIAWDHLINPQLAELRNEYDGAKSIDLINGGKGQVTISIVKNAYPIFKHFTALVDILERPQVTEARTRVSGVLLAALDDLRKTAKEGASAASFVLQIKDGLRSAEPPVDLGRELAQEDSSLGAYSESVRLHWEASLKRSADLIEELQKLDAQLKESQ